MMLRLGKLYVLVAVAQFIFGLCLGFWFIYNGQQPLAWIGGG